MQPQRQLRKTLKQIKREIEQEKAKGLTEIASSDEEEKAAKMKESDILGKLNDVYQEQKRLADTYSAPDLRISLLCSLSETAERIARVKIEWLDLKLRYPGVFAESEEESK